METSGDMTWFRHRVEWERLLALASHELGVESECIRVTAAWRNYSGSADSLDVVEFIMALEEEIHEATRGRDNK